MPMKKFRPFTLQSARLALATLFALGVLFAPPLARGQEPAPEPAEPAATPAGNLPAPSAKLISPAKTIETFIEGYLTWDEGGKEDAILALDLSGIDAILREGKSDLWASQLKEILDKTRFIDYAELPSDPDFEGDYEIEVHQDAGTEHRILIGKMPNGDWKFSASTIAALEELYAAYAELEVVQGLAPTEVQARELKLKNVAKNLAGDAAMMKVLGLEMYQWFLIAVIIPLGVALGWIAPRLLAVLLSGWLKSKDKELSKNLHAVLMRPVSIAVAAWIWYMGMGYLVLPDMATRILLAAVKLITVVSLIWTLYGLIDALGAFLAEQARKTDNPFDDLVAPILTRTLKVFAIVVGVIVLADMFEMPLKTVLAGLGLGGLAFALAAKDTIENLFGSMTVLLDRPFNLGDWVIIGDKEGSIESVGIRSTRIRTFYNSLITIPNSQLINAVVDNMGERRYRRISYKLGIAYDTPPEKIEAFCEGIRELIRQHPYTRKDYYHVWLNEFGESSLNILLYCFHEAPDWATELRERHRLFLDILRLAQRLGVEFAFPTQTLHLHTEPPAQPDSGGAVPDQIDSALRAGRDLAREVVRENLEPGAAPPAPVDFQAMLRRQDKPLTEQRRDGSAGDADGGDSD